MSVTAYKRNAVWWYSISDKRLPKRIRRAAPQAKLKRDAIDEGERVKRALLGGNTPDELSPNFSAFVDEVYLPYSKATKKSFKAEYGHCKALKEFFGKYQLHQIKPLLIETFKRERKASITQYKRPRSGTATNREVETLSCIMTMAVNNEMIAGNPCRKVASYKEMPRNRYMTYEEEARLMAVLDVPQRAILKAQVVMALHTGMRKSEIRKLTWGNVDFERQVLLVKGKTGDRIQVINQTTSSLLASLPRGEDIELVFGKPDYIRHGFTWACKKAGIKNLHFHDLRHTFAVRVSEQGANAFIVSSLLGHTSVQMTARYAHSTDSANRSAVAGLDRNLSQNGHTLDFVAHNRKAANG